MASDFADFMACRIQDFRPFGNFLPLRRAASRKKGNDWEKKSLPLKPSKIALFPDLWTRTFENVSRYFAEVGRNPENATLESMGLDIQEITFSFSCG